MPSAIRLSLLIAFAAALSFAQPTPPIDNDQAHVVNALDQPHVKSQPHEHRLNRVMIYLQDGSQEITPQGGKKTTLKFKAGEVRFSPASTTHVSEIVSDKSVNIVEIELKKPGAGKKIDTPLDPLKVAPKNYKLEFENDQVRVIRVKFPAHFTSPMHEHVLNRVVVYLTNQNTKMTSPDGKVDVAVHKAGEASWGGPTQHKEENMLDGPFEAVVVEFKY
jgi:hypothetical protein